MAGFATSANGRFSAVHRGLAQLQSQGDLSRFLNGLTSLLDQLFDRITANTSLAGAICSVLSLQLDL